MYAQQIAHAQDRGTELRRQADAYRLARAAKAAGRRPRVADSRGRWVRAA